MLLIVLCSPCQSQQGKQATQVFADAVAALSAGDYHGAEAGFLAVLKQSPNHIGALGNLGVVYSRSQQLDKAVAVYRRALALAPADPQLLLNLGLTHLRANAEAEALPLFRKLVQLRPQDVRARELLAACELHAGDANKAVTMLEALRKQDADNAALLYLLGVGYLKTKDRDRARDAFAAFLTTAPPSRSGLVMCQALYESGLLEEAEAQCRQALAADPSLSGVQRELGKVLVSRRDAEAAAVLRQAIAADPADHEALYFLGALLVREDRVREAMPLLEKARELNPGFWGNYFYLGRARLQDKNIAGAIALLEKVAELNGADSSVQYQLSRAYAAAGKPEQARQALQRVRELKAQGLEADRVVQ